MDNLAHEHPVQQLCFVAAVVIGLMLVASWLDGPKAPKPSEALCYNDNNMKTDYCSKIGKQWRV